MPTHCRPDSLDFGSVEGRSIIAAFDGGEVSSDGGALLLAKTNAAIRLTDRAAAAFTDRRNPDLVEHEVRTMVGQRIIGEALCYPDINDHDRQRHDPLLASILGKLDARDKRCAPLAGKSTLNQLEHSPQEGEARAPHRYHKISHDGAAIDQLFDARQPAAPVLLRARLRAHVRTAADRARRHQAREGDLRHDPPVPAEDRRAYDHLGAPRESRAGHELSVARAVRGRTRATMRRRALTRTARPRINDRGSRGGQGREAG